ncbi:TPR end-of-group domain-containing protein [Mucilaginibacter glaciei]|uniref:Transglutaminase domain-containing protein n=1 Tax=Mucilaginibacter glaciei TaxID=2772109 RepID=A0A926NUE0_9SPHI|nr:transglutaminase domain-containing protein [Mucilaginibacter glaciei]MBD1391924.1 transglutaminase domain-containing protein [Mucilaginibacter glaciei]
MKFYCLLLVFSLYTAGTLFAQTESQKQFTPYAQKQSDLLQKAYDSRDAEGARKIVAVFAGRYKTLNKEDKVYYQGNLLGAYYNLSCVYALINQKADALQYLDSAIVKGYQNYKHLLEDSDFATIRDDVKFQGLAERIRATTDYMYILQKAGKYNNAERRAIPAFSYQQANAPELVTLRKKLKLDSVAGTGTEVSKMLNILHWVHNSVNHDGQHESGITLINADEIIGAAKARKVGVSCGELASVLQDCYLAMGWKTRKVYCFPKDSLKRDFDSHVINVVYVSAKHKWIWVDPTNNAYVTDDKGEILSIQEVREYLVTNKPLAINTDANWNNRMAVKKEDYLYRYMAKNLYMMYSPLKSEYDYQTPGKNKEVSYVSLLPLDYFLQTPQISVSTKKATGTKIIWYRTNNADKFWNVD